MPKRTCSVEGCERVARLNGWCDLHNARVKRLGAPGQAAPLYVPRGTPCGADDCERRSRSRGLCKTHYERWRVDGYVGGPIQGGPRKRCSIPECECFAIARGWCRLHWERWKRLGSTDLPERVVEYCVVDGCEALSKALGWCDRHYYKYRSGPKLRQRYREDPEYRAKCRARDHRPSHLMRKFNLTLAEFEQMLEDQGGACAICGNDSPDDMGKTWNVDHDHETGLIRGLLCRRCNVALGWFKDNARSLRSAADYVEVGGCASVLRAVPVSLEDGLSTSSSPADMSP